MAPTNLSPAFAYTVVYVRDVAKSVAFYSAAFGYSVRRLDDSNMQLESGQTTIAFTAAHQRETDVLTGAVQVPEETAAKERGPVEICFDYADVDVDAAYCRAVDNGAVPVSPPEPKKWGQKVGYVRDMDGITVRMGSYVNEPPPPGRDAAE
uniref:VOC domain-containing protein n=1 Tax=Ananas comosus var. bracteatus TaxID=296719 RepID=A0A6V7QTZ9_ANACO